MAHEWESVAIGSVAKIYDGPHATPKLVGSGPVFLGIDALDNGRLDLSKTRHVSESDFKVWTRRVAPQSSDIVFSYETRIGQAALIPAGLKCCLGRRLALIRADSTRVDSRYLLYQYLSPAFQDFLRTRTIPGSTVDRIHLRDFPSFNIVLPPLREQKAIAELLGTLDEKIALNQRTAETLELTARTLFHNWMDIHGRSNLVLVRDLIEEQVLQIGDGYRAKNDELAAPGLPFLRAADLNGGINTANAATLSAASVSKAGSKISRPGDIAFTSKGTVGRFARVDEHTPEFVYSPQVCFWRSVDKVKLHPALLYLMMRSPAFISQIEQAAGQTDMAPYVSLQDQRRMFLPELPAQNDAFGDDMELLLHRKALLEGECLVLSDIRDTLLPRLISGEVRVPEAARAIEAA